MSDLSGPGLSEMGDDPVQDGVLEGGASETNLSQLPRFITLKPQQDGSRECSVYRFLASACAMFVRGIWLQMPSRIYSLLQVHVECCTGASSQLLSSFVTLCLEHFNHHSKLFHLLPLSVFSLVSPHLFWN